ncbi:hypothetical protein AAGC94_16095 [Clostridium sporogenes]|uniref:hypothetical protein n=1 Tax=Clostridium TaxID=1485 RepID=UPI001EDEDB9E|nr:hypothetical protein [Clostridium cochlearium]MBV1820064.1 hypothetical protein [Bacteroidales bacterium MSK.15.36]MCG4580931.1 hypothetical protein [Clostridium cochlearium]
MNFLAECDINKIVVFSAKLDGILRLSIQRDLNLKLKNFIHWHDTSNSKIK